MRAGRLDGLGEVPGNSDIPIERVRWGESIEGGLATLTQYLIDILDIIGVSGSNSDIISHILSIDPRSPVGFPLPTSQATCGFGSVRTTRTTAGSS